MVGSRAWAQRADRRRAASRLDTVVDAVQMPAWVARAGARLPLAPGDTVASRDLVQTAEGAALVLRLPEGSQVRLGEKTQLAVAALGAGEADAGLQVRAQLRLVEGFFRFATSAVSRVVGSRQISVELRTATIGIRGTDFWSMTDAEHDAACLFEGRIDLETRDQGPLVLDQPTAFWARFFQRPVQPVGNATPQQLNTFLGSTELRPGRGVAVAGGDWRVIAAASADRRAVADVAGLLRAAGYAARMAARAGVHVVDIGLLASEADARAIAERIAGMAGVEARVARMR